MRNFILKDENAVFFECGYSCDNEIFIRVDGRGFFITDPRYYIEAKECSKNCEVIEAKGSLIKEARLLLRKLGIKMICFNPNDFSHMEYNLLSYNLGVHFIQKPNFSQIKRMIKSGCEIEILRDGAKFGAEKFDEFGEFVNKFGIGMSEKELNFHAQNIFKGNGKFGLSFAPIVAINANAAKAHALPSDTILKQNDLLLLDAGITYKRFCSDRTRTVCVKNGFKFDKNQKFNDAKKDEIYSIVKEAQNLAINAIKPGIEASKIDKIAREYIAKFGYEKEFFHSTGHGVGLDIHELPNINARSSVILEPGMVFSVEPGIYLEGEFGVRIEDVVVVTDDGCEIL